MTYLPYKGTTTAWISTVPASPNATTDQTAALQAAVNGHQAAGWGVIDLQGARVRIDGGLTVNPRFTTLQNGILDFSSMTAGQALTVSTDSTVNYAGSSTSHSLRNIRMLGTNAVDGLVFDSQKIDNILNAVWNVDGLDVADFNRNIVLRNHTYCTYFRNVACGRGKAAGIATVAGSVDAGERIHFTDTTIYNGGGIGFDNSGGFEIFYSGSIDYNAGAQIVSAGGFEISGHVEFTPNAGTVPFQLVALAGQSAGSITFSEGSSVTFNGYNGANYVAPYAVSSMVSYQNFVMPAGTYGFGGTNGVMSGPGAICIPNYSYAPLGKNLLAVRSSGNLGHAAWSVGSSVTVTPNAGTFADGSQAARLQMPASGDSELSQNEYLDQGPVMGSVLMKSGTGANQTVHTRDGVSGNIIALTVTPAEQRFSWNADSSSSQPGGKRFWFSSYGTACDVLVGQCQLERGTTATAYTPS